jgi:hypothetical protein
VLRVEHFLMAPLLNNEVHNPGMRFAPSGLRLLPRGLSRLLPGKAPLKNRMDSASQEQYQNKPALGEFNRDNKKRNRFNGCFVQHHTQPRL